MKKISIATVVLFYLSFSCKKENYNIDTSVEGYVIDFITKDSLTNTEVQLWEDDRGGTIRLSDFDRKIATVYTVQNGYYKINFAGSRIKYYGIRAIKNNYDNNADLEVFGIPPTTKVNFNLIPLSWLKIHIKNELPTSIDDSIFFSPNINMIGENVDTVFYRQFRTTSTQYDFWHVRENGVLTQYSQITNCAAFDTCSINVIY